MEQDCIHLLDRNVLLEYGDVPGTRNPIRARGKSISDLEGRLNNIFMCGWRGSFFPPNCLPCLGYSCKLGHGDSVTLMR